MKKCAKEIQATVLALCVCALCAACGNSAKATDMRLARTDGAVIVWNEDMKELKAVEDMGLYSGYQMETERESYAWIDLDKVKLAKLDERSDIEIQKSGKDLEILVNEGSLYFNIMEPLKDDETMNIRTSNMGVGIRGTCGWVEVSDRNYMSVYILEGVVECTVIDPASGEEKSMSVSAGQAALMRLENGEITINVEQFQEAEVPLFVMRELDEKDLEEYRVFFAENSAGGEGGSRGNADEAEYAGSEDTDGAEENDVAGSGQSGVTFVAWADAGLEDHVMEWGDEALEQRMRELTGIAEENVMLSDVWEITSLDLYQGGIENLSALGELTNLTELYLNDNKISDIAPLRTLTNLTGLYLNNNQVSDVSSLGTLSNLTRLEVGNNQIGDVSSFGTLTSLTDLYLNDNQISDVSPLGTLTNMTHLYLYRNEISDVSPLGTLANLTILLAHNNQISDVSSLSMLTNLTSLELNNNQIRDISPLSTLTGLSHLNLGGNEISDVSSLSVLVNLNYLDLRGNEISDVSFLSMLASLQTIQLDDNQISDVSFLGTLTNLKNLYLKGNQISDVAPLSTLTKLTYLDLRENNIADYSPLDDFPEGVVQY